MSSFKAQTLDEVSKAISLEPLDSADDRYTDLCIARGTKELLKLRRYLENCAANDHCACAAFIGHRGSGKSTELSRLTEQLRESFTPLHLFVDNSLQLDCDYTDLFLWLVDSLIGFSDKQKIPLDSAKAKAVADWFAERTIESVDERKSEIELATEAEVQSKASANFWLFSYSLKLLARLKARVVGNKEHRVKARRQLQNYSDDLLTRVNELLADARRALGEAGRPPRLLIVQDNLDRLRPEAAIRLFRDNGDLLKQLCADCIWTVPINARLAPFGIGALLNNVFSMPTIKVHDRSDKPVAAGIKGLVELVGKRIEISLVFASRKVVEYLAAMSGGSVRDLLRLISEAQLAAQVDEAAVIEMSHAQEAVKKLRLDFQGLFVPGDAYYPLLANVARTKQDAAPAASASPDQAEANRRFFADLLVNGSILEYNGNERWCDVHPVVRDITAFKDASKATKPKAKGRKGPAKDAKVKKARHK